MIPEKLSQEVTSLQEVGHSISFIEEGAKILIVFKDHKLPSEIWNSETTDVLVWTSTSYPLSGFDMFWTTPTLTLKSGQIPKNASVITSYLNSRWRRFSIHPYQVTPWNPAKDSLIMFLSHINQRLNYNG